MSDDVVNLGEIPTITVYAQDEAEGNAFLNNLTPTLLDWTETGITAYSGLLSKLSTAGLTGAELESMSATYSKAVDLPIFSWPFMAVDAGVAYQQSGVAGMFKSIGSDAP